MSNVEDENAKRAVEKLLENNTLNSLVKKGELNIVKAKYYLKTGQVKML
jgi:carbonic anhydrase